MVVSNAQLALFSGAALGAVVVVALLVRWRARRAATRRLLETALRLERMPIAEGRGLERAFDRLAHAADETVVAISDAEARAERLEEAFGYIGEGVIICDETGEILFRNERAKALTHDRHAEMLAENAVLEVLSRTLAEGPQNHTLELFGPPRRMLRIRTMSLAGIRRAVGAVALIEDTTERRHLESVRRDFVTNITHELKAPVGALGLLAETLLSEDDPAVAQRLARRMTAEAQRVGRVIEDLLDLSRIEAEEAPVREPVPVHLVLAEAAERTRARAEDRGVGIVITEPPRRLAIVGDRRQVVSALHKLLDNAVSYSPEGSAVDVTARTDGRRVEIAVQDRGAGIPARDLERIFERFYRVDRSVDRMVGGTGLGLAVVRHVASNHGGDVQVQSEEGAGSTFTLRLPAAPGPVSLTADVG